MIKFQEVKEKDLNILANIFTAISLDTKTEEDWTYDTSLSYLHYFYQNQPDLFICTYDDNIPIGAVMCTLKPYFDGTHLTGIELFVSEEYREQNIEKKLLEMNFELANAKYNATHIDAITYINTSDSNLDLYKKIGLEPNNNLALLNGKLEDCLEKIREEF